jgi:sulfite reductase (NADPH) hemoprotein beta-component
MPKPFKPKVLTANDLVEGDAVFLGAEGWGRAVAAARVAATPEEAAALEAEGAAAERANLVVGPYLVEVSLEGGAPEPIARRERIRASREPTFAYAPAGTGRAAEAA